MVTPKKRKNRPTPTQEQAIALRKLKRAATTAQGQAHAAMLVADAAPEGPAGEQARGAAHEALTRAFALAAALKVAEARVGVLPE
jgi:hypothetical protein